MHILVVVVVGATTAAPHEIKNHRYLNDNKSVLAKSNFIRRKNRWERSWIKFQMGQKQMYAMLYGKNRRKHLIDNNKYNKLRLEIAKEKQQYQ